MAWFSRKQTTPALVQIEHSQVSTSTEDAKQKKNKVRSFMSELFGGYLNSGWQTQSSSLDYQLISKLVSTRAKARSLATSNAYVSNYLQIVVNNVVGSAGFTLQATNTDNSGNLTTLNNNRLEEQWAKFSKNCSIDNKHTLTTFLSLIMKTLPVDGEAFIQIVERSDGTFRLKLIDAALVDEAINTNLQNGGKIVMGVELDADGAPVAYHVKRGYDGETALRGKSIRIPASDIIHIYDPLQVTQTRGFSWLAPVLGTLHQLEEYNKAELVSARVRANHVQYVKMTDAAINLLGDAALDPDLITEYKTAPGATVTLDPGYEVVDAGGSNLPTAYAEFVSNILKQIASGLHVSYNALATDLSDVNYSSMRSGLLLEREYWKLVQNMLIDRVLGVVYERFVDNLFLYNKITVVGVAVPEKFKSYKLMARGWDWVDPLKDVEASVTALAAGLTTRTALLAEKGIDFEDLINQRKREDELLAAAGLSFDVQKPNSTPQQ